MARLSAAWPDFASTRATIAHSAITISAATPPVPQQTVETVKEDVEWAKTQAPSAQR